MDLDLHLSGNPASQAWIGLIRRIHDGGTLARPRGLQVREVLCHTTRVDMRMPIVSVKSRKMGFRFMAAEAWWILSGRNDVASISPFSSHIAYFSNDGRHFDGAYGPRIVDQLRYVVDTLRNDPDSRQAVLEIWRPNPRESKDVPCTLCVQWLIRDGKLHCIDTMRSSDAWLGWPYDVFNFSMLSAYVLLLLRTRFDPEGVFAKLELGALWLTAGSSHLYVDPKADGNNGIPYSHKDVERVLEEEKKTGSRDTCESYSPLDMSEFDSPEALLRRLDECKNGAGILAWRSSVKV